MKRSKESLVRGWLEPRGVYVYYRLCPDAASFVGISSILSTARAESPHTKILKRILAG